MVVSVASVGCDAEKTNLEKLAAEEEAAKQAKAKGEGGQSEGGAEGGGAEGEAKPSAAGPSAGLARDAFDIPIPATEGAAKLVTRGSDDRGVTLRLALADDAVYRVTTIGMLQLPLFNQPTGFAREEEVRLRDCAGEGQARRCTVVHSYRHYDAEPPTGDGLERDEATVAGLTSTHGIDATGLRTTATTLEGPEEQREAKPGADLATAHRFYCIRFPDEPVGEGATWTDTCRMRQSGKIVTRELTWQVQTIEDSEEGTRVTLQYAGTVFREDSKKSNARQRGQVKGDLLFFADAGEPHLMRERLVFTLDAAKGVVTNTQLRYQFAKVTTDEKGAETLVRTDGKPYEQPPIVLNDPSAKPPAGAEGGAEGAGEAGDKKAPPAPR